MNYTNLIKKLKSKAKISCIIPAWNEEERIEAVLDSVYDYPFFHEIVVVNDASTDKTSDMVSNFATKNIQEIVLPDNLGKTGAVLHGIEETDGDIIVLLDADLVGLTHEDISKMLYFIMDDEYSMTILDRGGDRKSPIGWTNLTRFFGGERALFRKDFDQISFNQDDGYLLESKLNMYFLENSKRVRTIYSPYLSGALQFRKHGHIKAFKRYIKMFWGMYKESKFRGFYLQIRDIEEDRIEKLYDLQKKSKQKTIPIILTLIVGLISAIGTTIFLNVKKSHHDEQEKN